MAKDLTPRGIFIGKGMYNAKNSDTIRVARVYDMSDEDSPDGISFAYDIFDILPNCEIAFCDGGCYWGYNSAIECLGDFCDVSNMKEVFDSEIDDMVFYAKFNYDKLNSVLNQ